MKRLFLLLSLLTIIGNSFAQGGFRNTYVSFTSKASSSLDDYSQDISQSWERYNLTEGVEQNSRPSIDTIPNLSNAIVPTGKQLRVSEVRHVIEYASPLETDTRMRWRHTFIDTAGFQNISFDFYGQRQIVPVPTSLGLIHPSDISERAVADYWKLLAQHDIRGILMEGEKRRSQSGYNDWAILLWVQQLSHAVFPQDRYSECTIFSVYLLNQMGMMTRMARVRNRLTILFAAKQTVYGRKYVVLDTYPFYMADPSIQADEVYTYGNTATMHTFPLDLRFLEPIVFGNNSYKTLRKQSKVLEKTLILPVNMSLMAFYSQYPQLEAREYALSQPEPHFKEAILATIRPIIEGKSDREAVDQLLGFLQKDFDYKVDIEQFGYEKPFFPEENFIYAYNDCEDRAILLSFLVWNLLHKKMVLLDYEDHLAAAVCLGDNGKGDYVRVDNEKYFVCDPSCTNATVGVSMPQYRNRAVKVWVL